MKDANWNGILKLRNSNLWGRRLGKDAKLDGKNLREGMQTGIAKTTYGKEFQLAWKDL